MNIQSVALALLMLTAPSDQSLKSLSLEQLANIAITTVSKEPEEVRKTPAAVFVITQNDIRRSGATSIPEILRLAPGVEVSQIDSGHWSVGIRGFQGQFSSSVLVMIDGRTVYTPLFAGVYWDVQNVLLDDVERIEVIRGPGGTIWGANAFQGVINIITRDANDTHGTVASVGGGNVDQATGAFRWGGGNGKTFDYRGYSQFFTRGPELHLDKRQFDDWRMQQSGFRADWKKSNRDAVTLQGDIYHGDVGEMVSVASFAPLAEIDLQGNDRVSGGNIRAQWHHESGQAGKFQIQGYYDRTNRTAPHYTETRDTFDLDFLHHWSAPGRQDISWGFGARWSPSTFTSMVPLSIDFIPSQQTERIYSGFVQDEIHILPRHLSLVAGNKWERNIYTGVEVQPSARLLWIPNEHQTFWASVAQAVRTPSRLDRDFFVKGFLLASPPIFLKIAGSPTFNSERLVGYEAGYRTLITSKLHLDISAYHNRYHYLSSLGASVTTLEKLPITYFQLAFPYANGIGGTTDGFEIAPEWVAASWWQWKGSYSSLHMNMKNEPGNGDQSAVSNYEGSSPHHQAAIQSHMDLPGKLELDLNYRYVGALPAQLVPAYGTAGARLGWSISKTMEFSLTGQNLLQPHHAEFGRSPEALVQTVRSVYAKITWKR